MITVDARRAGSGKTKGPGGTHKRIINIIARGERVLVVVPSIKLQKEYITDLPRVDFTVINSDDATQESTTVAQLLDAFRNGDSAILITHKTFTMSPPSGYNNNYHLIIDEALDNIINVVEVANIHDKNATWMPDLRMYELYSFNNGIEYATWCARPTETQEWYKMQRIASPGITTFRDSKTFRQLTDPNYDLWVTANSWSILTSKINGSAKVITTLSPHILDKWASIHIAAAAFDHTMMALWMKGNSIDYVVTDQFIRHTGNIHLHAPEFPRIRSKNPDVVEMNKIQLSKSMLRRDASIRQQYHEYVEANRTGDIISVRNNCFADYSEKIEKRISHNVHGVNEYIKYVNVNIETAIIPDTQLVNFLKWSWLSKVDSDKIKDKIADLYRGYMFYQVVMRGDLRNKERDPNTQYDIFVLDETAVIALANYLDVEHIHEIPIQLSTKSIERNTGGRPKKYLTDEERREANKQRMRLKRANKSA